MLGRVDAQSCSAHSVELCHAVSCCVQARNDGGSRRLLEALTSACTAISTLYSMGDVDVLMQTLFQTPLQQVQQPNFDPIGWLEQLQHQQRQQRQQPLRQQMAGQYQQV